ncbi:two-component sensor histidine kinase [Sphingomonas metalli]|uniref:histidine kinase n=1 Tax=Sphingomonas metalli TaxID=1779358 RepID=A0A916WQY6_9SPHN|nr:HAMP domain-containing sensor histidine kinase [Sphingomonas metalli]GGB22233.1 two-component sensor histidine kinase [Sphingomonas metalli]
MQRASTTRRLAALVFAFQIAAAAVLLGSIGVYVRWEIAGEATRSGALLREDLLAVYGRGGREALRRTIWERSTRLLTPGAVMLLTDAAGSRLAGNLDTPPAGIAPDDGTVETVLLRRHHQKPEAMRIRATVLPDGSRLVTGMVIQREQRALGVFADASVAALVLAIGFAAATAWAAARLFSSRLEAVAATLHAAREGDLARRVPQDHTGDAFAALGHEVNATLDRLKRLMDELRLATDALAHDLKSPITRMRSSLERARAALADADPADPARDAVERANAEGQRLLGIVETALSISRAEAGIGRASFQPVDLPDMLEALAEIYGPLAEDRGRRIDVAVGTPLPPVAVHRELLGQALGNLIDNALKYGAGTITLSLDRRDGQVLLGVADEGPGIPQAQHGDALRRFGRLDAARTSEGAGLGLSLVHAVAQLHDGRLRLGDAAPGLAVTIALPG